MKLLLKLGKEAIKYKALYIIAILATFALTIINLIVPKILSSMTALVEQGMTEDGIRKIGVLTAVLIGLYLLKILFRYLSSYLAHKAAWNLVEDMRIRIYDYIQSFSMSFFSNKQTGDLMCRVVNDTSTFELLYAHIIPEMITNIVTVIGVMIILITTKVRPNFRVSQKSLAELNAKLQDNFSGVHEIQAFCQEDYETQEVINKAYEDGVPVLKDIQFSCKP